MASSWVKRRTTARGEKRHIVEYRLGGRATRIRYAGSFRTRRDANSRKAWLDGELAAMRVPDLAMHRGSAPAETLDDAAERWKASRVDVGEDRKKGHRSDIARVFKAVPALRSRRVGTVTPDDLVAVVAAFTEAGYKRETMKKSRDALAMVFDFCGINPNPARDKRVRLPKERKPHIPPPLAEHIERVAEILPRHHVVPFLVIDECGPRVNELVTAQLGDLDEHRRAIRVRPSEEKNERYRLLELPDDLFDALLATLPPREDRDLEDRLFPGLTDAALRTAITKACKATGTPHFSPHGLRRRRGSLYYKRTGSLAEVAQLLGDSERVARQHYVYAMTDYREVDRTIALARAKAAR
jgi:integrase